MAGRESMGTTIDPGLVQRIAQGDTGNIAKPPSALARLGQSVRYLVTGVGPTNFFGPMQPLVPLQQEEVEGRAWDFPVGYNLRIQPRSGEQIDFSSLRALADGYDLMRLIIETRKDQIKSFKWEVMPVDETVSSDDPKVADRIISVSKFLEQPDKEHDWDDWISMFLEDLLVIDAVCVYPRLNRGNKLHAFELVDGATIKRVLNVDGRTPEPPDPAYQQVIKGIPAADYSRDTLIYMMRNPRTSRVYGYSPVEQVLMTVNIALRRQLTQLDFYTQGTVPEAIAQVPETWTAKQIKDFQEWWDGVHEGASAQQKRKMRFIPMLKDIVFPRQEVLKDEYDEWLARIICFAFNIPPTPFVKQLNRATAQQSADTAKEEGLLPLLEWVQNKMTRMIQRHLGFTDLKFNFKLINKVTPLEQAQIDQIYITAQVVTPDEVREDLGRDAMDSEDRAKAFPQPPAFGPDGKPVTDKDGVPVPAGAKVLPFQSEDDKAKAAAKETEKLLANIATLLKAVPPSIVELRPEVNVEVGDTNVSAFPSGGRQGQARTRLGKMLVSERLADGRMAARWVDDPSYNPLDTDETNKVLVASKDKDGRMVAKYEDASALTPIEKKDAAA